MIIGNTKWVLFNFVPYEYKYLESYLEKMALKGWKLENIRGVALKFRRIKPQKLKYSVDIMDRISFFDGKNSDSALEYREYCKAAGWDFLCQREKIQVYCTDNEADTTPIYTDEKEKYSCVFKASLKYIILNLFTVVLLLFSQYMITLGSYNAGFLASNLNLFSLLMVILFTIHEITGLINFIIWAAKARISLKKEEKVSYNFSVGIKIKRTIYFMMLALTILTVLLMIINGESIMLKILGINILIVLAVFSWMSLVSRTSYKEKKKRKINIIGYIVIIIFSFILMSRMIFSESWSSGKINHSKINNENSILSLKDFNDESKSEDSLYIDENNSILASNLFYSDIGKKSDLSYELFQSKYQWAIKYSFNKEINKMKKHDIEYVEQKTDLPKDIKVYVSKLKNTYLMVSSNKLIKVTNWDNDLSEKDLLNKIYDKVFK